jgi:hypothetical protein
MTMTSVIPTARTAMYPVWFSRLAIFLDDINTPCDSIVNTAMMAASAIYMPYSRTFFLSTVNNSFICFLLSTASQGA